MNIEKNGESTVQKDIRKLLQKGVFDEVFPCAAAGILYGTGKERKKMIIYAGNSSLYPEKRKFKKHHFFDLASLTKPLSSTMAVLCLLKENKTYLNEKLPSLLEKKINTEKKNITLKQLLSHSSGLPAYKDYYNVLKDIPVNRRWDFVENLLLHEELDYNPGSGSLYSDLGFMLLGRIIEKKSKNKLDKFVREKVFKPLSLDKNIFYNNLFKSSKRLNKEYVATETCSWRKKTLCGEVHDDNCFTMGGVAGHSGLFGDIESVTAFTGHILDMWKDKFFHPYIDNNELQKFLIRQEKIPGCSRTLGFDTKEEMDSSCGKYFSSSSVGHLGFTGTSFWIDPEKEIVVVLLSNRVHPSRDNSKIKQFRPFYHNMVMEKILSI